MCKINYAPVMISALYSGPEYDCNFGRTHEDKPVQRSPFMIQALYNYKEEKASK